MTTKPVAPPTPAFQLQAALSFAVALAAVGLQARLDKLLAEHDPFVGPTA